MKTIRILAAIALFACCDFADATDSLTLKNNDTVVRWTGNLLTLQRQGRGGFAMFAAETMERLDDTIKAQGFDEPETIPGAGAWVFDVTFGARTFHIPLWCVVDYKFKAGAFDVSAVCTPFSS